MQRIPRPFAHAVRFFTLAALLIGLSVMLSGCDALSSLKGNKATPTPSNTPAPTLEPLPTPTAVPKIAVEDTMYVQDICDFLALSFKRPEHWLVSTGRSSVSMYEPAEENARVTPRIAISISYLNEKQTQVTATKQLETLMSSIGKACSNLTQGKVTDSRLLLNISGAETTYVAIQNGREVRGHVIVVPSGSQLVAIHYSAPRDKYPSYEDIFEIVCQTVKRL